MNGSIVGGWEYVWAAYLITWASLALYGGSLLFREKKTRDRIEPKHYEPKH
jgi:hypothetical protein